MKTLPYRVTLIAMEMRYQVQRYPPKISKGFGLEMSSQCKYSWPCAFDGSIRNLESRALVLPVGCVEV